MKIKVIKLGVPCRDKATGLTGMLTHWLCNMGQEIIYLFQPKGLNADGGPVDKISLERERLEATPAMFEEVEIPFEILGTEIYDKASGYKGMAIAFVRHINGCFHVQIQPPGILKKTNSPIPKEDFDLRQCAGKKIAQLNALELAESKKKKPGPTKDKFSEPFFRTAGFPR